jgi:ABC-2 type transport system ATP-binding protein
LVRPTAGAITVDGIDAIASPRRVVKKVGAILEGNRNIYWRLTVKENLEFFAELSGISSRTVRPEIDQLLERFSIADKRDTPARMLSKGMQQKLALACVFIKKTPLLLLDEPTLGLDVTASHELRSIVRDLATKDGRTVVLSSHDMAVVQDVCERVVIISNGRVVTDDHVANLIQLFHARAYTFTLAHGLSELQRAEIASRSPISTITTDGERTTIDVEIPDGTGLYQMIDVLRDGETIIESIDRRDPNLEEIFLRIVQGSTT